MISLIILPLIGSAGVTLTLTLTRDTLLYRVTGHWLDIMHMCSMVGVHGSIWLDVSGRIVRWFAIFHWSMIGGNISWWWRMTAQGRVGLRVPGLWGFMFHIALTVWTWVLGRRMVIWWDLCCWLTRLVGVVARVAGLRSVGYVRHVAVGLWGVWAIRLRVAGQWCVWSVRWRVVALWGSGPVRRLSLSILWSLWRMWRLKVRSRIKTLHPYYIVRGDYDEN